MSHSLHPVKIYRSMPDFFNIYLSVWFACFYFIYKNIKSGGGDDDRQAFDSLSVLAMSGRLKVTDQLVCLTCLVYGNEWVVCELQRAADHGFKYRTGQAHTGFQCRVSRVGYLCCTSSCLHLIWSWNYVVWKYNVPYACLVCAFSPFPLYISTTGVYIICAEHNNRSNNTGSGGWLYKRNCKLTNKEFGYIFGLNTH